jgi:ligand-binding sensor domain-containing protein
VVQRRTRASLASLLLLCSSGALALDPSLDVSQYAHTAWKIRDGFTRGTITAIAQTPDGYLWLGTEFGLLRFDGVRAVPWQPQGEQLPASYIGDLAVTRDGTLWIGTTKGLASWSDNRLTHHPEVAGRLVAKIRQDRGGTLWFGAWDLEGAKPGRLCAVVSAKIQCEEHEGFGPVILSVYPDHLGNLWVSTGTGLWRWKPGPPEHYSFPGMVKADDLIEDESGALLLATIDGLKRLAGGRVQIHSLPGLDAVPRPKSFLRSSDGTL